MLSNKFILKPILTINEFLQLYDWKVSPNSQNILNLDFQLEVNYKSQRICPIIRIANLKDAREISILFKEIYKGTYPYKQMENTQEIRHMIKDQNYLWFIFKSKLDETIGCFGVHLEFEKKRGFLYGFLVNEVYYKKIDVVKAFIGCVLFLWKKYHDTILIWYSEMRTNENTSQHFTSTIGLKPIAFLPNKDVFFNKTESIVLHVIYARDALNVHRSKDTPRIIRQIVECYLYSNERYHLGAPIIENPKVKLNQKKIDKLKKKIVKKIEKNQFGNERITLSFKNSKAFFQVLFNPNSRNFEKSNYNVNNLEELYSFLKILKEFINQMDVHYFECFVSSYNPKHQKIFLDAGFIPRGYVPCWEYNIEKNFFEDRVVFNFHKGNISNNTKIIPETEKLLNYLNFYLRK